MPRPRRTPSTFIALFLVLVASCQASILTTLWSFATQKPAATHNPELQGDVVEPTDPVGRRVAIIGAGAAGSSSAYYLRRYLTESALLRNESVDITVFDGKPYIGGRSITVNAYDDPSVPIELGASIFVKINYNLYNATKELGLEFNSRDIADMDDAEELGVYNGKEMLLTLTQNWKAIPKIIWRYGPFSPRRAQQLVESVVGKFLNIYQEPVFPFDDLSHAVEELGLLDATGNTGEQYLGSNGISGKYVTEIIQASTRVNYGQNIGLIHGLETLVCQSTSGAVSIKGGNWQIFAGMLGASDAQTRLSTIVTDISRTPSGKWKLDSHAVDAPASQRNTDIFTDVIVAGPWQYANLTVTPKLHKTPDPIPYAPVYVTLFASPLKLDPTRFGLPENTPVPQYVLTTLTPAEQADNSITQGTDTTAVGSVGFFSVSIVATPTRPNPIGSGTRTEYIYKVFSPAHFSDEKIREMLGIGEELWGAVSWVKRHTWNAYPYEYPRVTFDDVRLEAGLWYTGGMESFVSTMETNSLMGRNVAKLVVQGWEREKEREKEKEEEKEEAVRKEGEKKMKENEQAEREKEKKTREIEKEETKIVEEVGEILGDEL